MATPTTDQIKNATKDVAWEYAALLGAALEMGQGHADPINHEVQEGFLVHVLRIPAKEIAHSDLMSIKIEASFRWTVIC